MAAASLAMTALAALAANAVAEMRAEESSATKALAAAMVTASPALWCKFGHGLSQTTYHSLLGSRTLCTASRHRRSG